MKKLIRLSVAAVILLVAFASCEKSNEWTNFNGYSKADIVGNYSYSQNDDAFEFLVEGKYCHICKDATIEITEKEDEVIRVALHCPENNFNPSFEGLVDTQSDSYLLEFVNNNLFFTSSVQRNEEGDILLHGHVRKRIQEVIDEVVVESYVNYYFDVIKN